MKRILRNIGIFFAVVAGTFLLFLILLDSFVMPYIVAVDRVTVPDLRGQAVAEASRRLHKKGLRLAVGDSVYHESLAKGVVVDQTPEARQQIKKGRRVFVDVSRGRRLYAVPAVVGSSMREARLRLVGSHLAVGRVRYVSSGSFPEGAVIQQRPKTGRPLPKGSRVNLEISSGSPFDLKRVPDLRGISIEAVEDSLVKYEMSRGRITERVDNSVPVGWVLSQDPAPGARQPRNTAIDLVVSVRAPERNTPR